MDRGSRGRLQEVAGLFLKLGLTAFGGPAAHLGMTHDEVVKRRHWLDDQEFLDLVGATNLIPGPNSTEMAIHIGFQQAGWPGLIVGGACFIVPAMLIVLVLAWAYVTFQQLPEAQWLLYGIKPVVIAIIIQAIWNLGRKAARNLFLLTAGLLILCLYWFLHLNEIILLFASGFAVMALGNIKRLPTEGLWALLTPPMSFSILSSAGIASGAAFSLPVLFLTFLKIGAILYGSGYVLLAFLRSDLVLRLHWLTDQQLLDAIAIGQVTPGPLFTSATFIGYILGGVPAAILATVGIFLPSFAFVAVLNPLVPRMRSSPWVSGFLDGVNIAALSLMAGVTIQLGQASLIDSPTVVIGAVALGLLLRYKLNSTWLIVGGALAGILVSALR